MGREREKRSELAITQKEGEVEDARKPPGGGSGGGGGRPT